MKPPLTETDAASNEKSPRAGRGGDEVQGGTDPVGQRREPPHAGPVHRGTAVCEMGTGRTCEPLHRPGRPFTTSQAEDLDRLGPLRSTPCGAST